MKNIKLFEDYFNQDNLFTNETGDHILKSFDENKVENFKLTTKSYPTYRHDGETIETEYTFNIDNLSIEVKHIKNDIRDELILIKVNGKLTNIPQGDYRREILKRCQEYN